MNVRWTEMNVSDIDIVVFAKTEMNIIVTQTKS